MSPLFLANLIYYSLADVIGSAVNVAQFEMNFAFHLFNYSCISRPKKALERLKEIHAKRLRGNAT